MLDKSLIVPLLVGLVPLMVAVFAYYSNKKNIDKKATVDEVKSIVDSASIIRQSSTDLLEDATNYWKDKFLQQEKECDKEKEKLRNDLGTALVENADLKVEVARLNGYINGITDPLVKLEEQQKAMLRSGRRLSDK
jgi:formiminotetrahydrofolate cyclodeaminase